MAINFPSSPAEGQILNILPGKSFVFRSGLWRKAPLTTALPKNYIVNPAMQISQESGDTALGMLAGYDYYFADQMAVQVSGALGTGRITVQRVQSVTPRGSLNRLRITVTAIEAVVGASSWINIHQKLEGTRVADFQWGTAGAQQAVLRFGFKAPAGQYNLSLRSGDFSRSYLAAFTIAAGEANTDTEKMLVVPGDVTGTWAKDNTVGIEMCVCLTDASGPRGVAGWQAGNKLTMAGNFNVLSSTSNVIELFDVGLYADPYKTGVAPPFQVPNIVEELRRCQRYWARIYLMHGCAVTATVAARMGTAPPAPMRVTPSLAKVGSANIFDGSVTPAISSFATGQSNASYIESDTTTASGLTAGRFATQYIATDADYIAANARM